MKNYGYRKCCIILIAAITGSLLLLPGCTPESPPLDPNTHSEVSGASSSDNSNATVKEKSQASAADPSSVSEKSSDKTESSMLSSEPEKSLDGTENSTISTESENNDKRTENGSVQSNVPANDSTLTSISDEIKGKIVEMTFRYTDETPETYYCTDDNDMLAKLTDALNGITTGKGFWEDIKEYQEIVLPRFRKRRHYIFYRKRKQRQTGFQGRMPRQKR